MYNEEEWLKNQIKKKKERNEGNLSKYVFDRLDTALYIPGNKASDYLPKHGMVILEYEDVDLILRLIIYSPNRVAEESIFAWALYKWDDKEQCHVLDSVTEALFDFSKSAREQVLPPKNRIGMLIYQKLTNLG